MSTCEELEIQVENAAVQAKVGPTYRIGQDGYPCMARDWDADILMVLLGRGIPIAHAQGVALGGIAAAGLERSTGECLSNWHFVEGVDTHAGLIPHMEEP